MTNNTDAIELLRRFEDWQAEVERVDVRMPLSLARELAAMHGAAELILKARDAQEATPASTQFSFFATPNHGEGRYALILPNGGNVSVCKANEPFMAELVKYLNSLIRAQVAARKVEADSFRMGWDDALEAAVDWLRGRMTKERQKELASLNAAPNAQDDGDGEEIDEAAPPRAGRWPKSVFEALRKDTARARSWADRNPTLASYELKPASDKDVEKKCEYCGAPRLSPEADFCAACGLVFKRR
jgi:hypothetical protein